MLEDNPAINVKSGILYRQSQSINLSLGVVPTQVRKDSKNGLFKQWQWAFIYQASQYSLSENPCQPIRASSAISLVSLAFSHDEPKDALSGEEILTLADDLLRKA